MLRGDRPIVKITLDFNICGADTPDRAPETKYMNGDDLRVPQLSERGWLMGCDMKSVHPQRRRRPESTISPCHRYLFRTQSSVSGKSAHVGHGGYQFCPDPDPDPDPSYVISERKSAANAFLERSSNNRERVPDTPRGSRSRSQCTVQAWPSSREAVGRPRSRK